MGNIVHEDFRVAMFHWAPYRAFQCFSGKKYGLLFKY